VCAEDGAAAEGENRRSYFPLLHSLNLPIIGASSIEIYQTARQQDFPGGMYVPDRENAGLLSDYQRNRKGEIADNFLSGPLLWTTKD